MNNRGLAHFFGFVADIKNPAAIMAARTIMIDLKLKADGAFPILTLDPSKSGQEMIIDPTFVPVLRRPQNSCQALQACSCL
ncbi:hypothetical protein HED63_05700 [Ochrobactrum cytisi]|nr:hypothetical protein [Brucella cytisi]